MCLGVADEIHDDQEIIRKPHLIDDAKLIVQPLLLFSRGLRIALRNGCLAELLKIGLGRLALRHIEGRKLVVAKSEGHMTALCDPHRILDGAGILA